jgi:predicted O-linked N-acetylglucosamine transferase (SPINDLY family)
MTVTDRTPSLDDCLLLHKNKQWQQAIDAYKSLLAAQPKNLVALVNLGAVYRQLGDGDNARQCYEQAVVIDAGFAEGWFNFGNLCFALKDFVKACECYEKVLVLQPDNIGAMYQLATVYREQQQWQRCSEQLVNLLAVDPNNTSALLELGNSWKHLGQSDKSRDCYAALIKIDKRSWKGQYSLAKWYDANSDTPQFEKHLIKALKYAPNHWVVHYGLAQARFDEGNYSGAKQQFELALVDNTDEPTTLIALGACAMRLGKAEQAKRYFEQVSKLDDVEVLSELARVIWEYKFFDEAIAILKKIVALRPDIPDVHLNLAKAQYEYWQMSAAEKSLKTALSIRPDYVEAEDLLANLMVRQGKVDECLPIFREKINRDGVVSSSVCGFLFSELYSANVSVEDKFLHHKEFMDEWVAQLSQPTVFTNSKDTTRKIKIGLVSADFRDQHPVGIFVQPLLDYLDKSRFSVAGYYTSRTYDDSTYQAQEKLDEWFDVADWADGRLRAKIINDEIDILVDLSGHTAKNRLRLFAMRAAPIQVTWMGYPHSSGLSTMDYMIADPIVCPPENDHLCSESVVRLPRHSVFCYPPTKAFGEVDIEKPASRKNIVFGSFNNLTKVNDTTLQLWRDVMLAVPNAMLKLKTPSFTDPECKAAYMNYFVQAGINAERLVFSGPSSLYDMMREYSEVDIALDTYPYNGGTTTFQALWMGVPVLTLAGNNFCGRMSASAMTRLDMPEWIANTREEFVTNAVNFAGDRDGLLETKAGLRDTMLQSPLCDTQGFGLEMNRVFEEMWVNYCMAGSTN